MASIKAPLPLNETQRLKTLRDHAVLDTLPEQAFDDLALLAAHICQTPVALISLVDEQRQWFKAKAGLNTPETSRDIAFCAHAILYADELLEVRRSLKEQKILEERTHLVVEGSPNAILMVDATGRITLANAQAESLFGYPRTELIGQMIEMLAPERFRAVYPRNRDIFFFDPRPRSMGAGRDLLALRKDGRELPVEIGLNPIVTSEGAFMLISIVDISERKQSAEALLRWQHPELGMVSPCEFIPVAEASGQIVQIGEWVLRNAARQLKAWIDSGLKPITMAMAVNLSAVQFRHLHLPDLVTKILEEVQLPPQHLELELTESVEMDDPLAAIAVMKNLHERGIRMSIDDFGTGYSSLSYIKRLHVYKLKIDQSFVRDITEDPDDKAIVAAIISMAKALGIQTIAEGVATEGQLAFLRENGCNEIQGYYYSKPLPAEQFEVFVRGKNGVGQSQD